MKLVRFFALLLVFVPCVCFGAGGDFQSAAQLLSAARRGDIQTVQVLINSGAFESLPATVTEVDRERGKLKAVVEMFGRETVAELDFEQVEKI